MIPISLCESKAESITTESFLIKKWQPSINGADKERPYWMVRPTYSKGELIHVAKKIRTLKKPWTADSKRPKMVLESPWGKSLLTTYIVNDKSYHNFGNLLKDQMESETEDIIVDIMPGMFDVTRWRRVKNAVGDSVIKIVRPGKKFCSTLREVDMLEEFNKGSFKLFIDIVMRKPVHVREEQLADIEKWEKRVADCDLEELEYWWRERKEMPGVTFSSIRAVCMCCVRWLWVAGGCCCACSGAQKKLKKTRPLQLLCVVIGCELGAEAYINALLSSSSTSSVLSRLCQLDHNISF